ncbi:DUF1838 family protein [Thalassotalea psychrophila]|uniref:DUF1838 family protein n=1 Tax=Thalassotalea psychrophila TaxID=3065647 RepID=A0ABY9TTJ3_9GAMM|nr:DUF1838 family protein [Colwelliaceae bacterium SQ149]
MTFTPTAIKHCLHPNSDFGSGSHSGTNPLDFNNAKDNLQAFAKLWFSFDDKPAVAAFHGLMFGAVGDNRLKPLFGYTGFGLFQAKLLSNGNVRIRGKEVGYFCDPITGDILEYWDNPYTGERVKVFNFFNDRIRGELTPEMPKFHFGDDNDAPTLMNEGSIKTRIDGSAPFILPWQRFGDNMTLAWDYTHRYRNPVTKDKWPKAHTGEFINPSEHFTFQTNYNHLADRATPTADFACGFSRISPWWPWMQMGQSGIKGHLFGRMNSHKSNNGFVDIPEKVLAYTEQHHPEYLIAPNDWDDGFPIGTWESYAQKVAPEIAL